VSYPFIYSADDRIDLGCSSAIILILPIAYNGARRPGRPKDFDKHSVINRRHF
jgi:hypothetical protein